MQFIETLEKADFDPKLIVYDLGMASESAKKVSCCFIGMVVKFGFTFDSSLYLKLQEKNRILDIVLRKLTDIPITSLHIQIPKIYAWKPIIIQVSGTQKNGLFVTFPD